MDIAIYDVDTSVVGTCAYVLSHKRESLSLFTRGECWLVEYVLLDVEEGYFHSRKPLNLSK